VPVLFNNRGRHSLELFPRKRKKWKKRLLVPNLPASEAVKGDRRIRLIKKKHQVNKDNLNCRKKQL